MRLRGLRASQYSIVISGLTTNVVIAPIWHVNAQKRLEQATVVLNSEMKQFVDDDKVLEAIVLIG